MLRHLARRAAAAGASPSSASLPAATTTTTSLGTTSGNDLVHQLAKTATLTSSSRAHLSSKSKNAAAAGRVVNRPSSPLAKFPAKHHSTSSSAAAGSTPVIPDAAPSQQLMKVSRLSNGVRVATDGTPGHFVAAGVYVGTGSRFEHQGNSGSSHMIDRLAFKSTKNRTGEQMTNEIEALGGQFMASSSREVIMYQASSYAHSTPSVVSLLSDTVLHPNITAEELELQKQSAIYELQEIKNKPELYLPEYLYEIAFQGNTLGNPLIISEERLQAITPEEIRKFRQEWFRSDRIVVAGAGIPHEQMVALAEQHFGDLEPPSPSIASSSSASTSSKYKNLPTHLLQSQGSGQYGSANSASRTGKAPYATATSGSPSLYPGYEELANARPRYTGGQVYDDSGADTMEFSHLFIGYEGLSIHDPDVYALATLQMLLGGGSSFSAGGPGKGMFSRLYTSLLNRYHDIEHCSAFHHCYNDTGLFAINISVNSKFIKSAPYLLADQLDGLMSPSFVPGNTRREPISAQELQRAKNQLKSSLVMMLESRLVQVEDLGRQALSTGHKVPIEEMLSKIDAVDKDTMQRVARRIFRPSTSEQVRASGEVRSGEPTILAAGRLDGIPDVREVLKSYGLAP